MVVDVLSSLLAQFLLLRGGGGLPLAYPTEADYETRFVDLEAEVSHPVVFVWGWSCLGVVSVLVLLFYCTLLW
ncbi:hypothetical protein P8452_66759 [Trifolium repens]|nr:hypothetical protein P8452_66759 [Trifolium repens]